MTYSFPVLEPFCCSMPSSNYCFLTCIQISQMAHQVVWYFHLLKNFLHFILIHTVKGFGVINKAEVDIFLELSCFFDDPVNCMGPLVSVIAAAFGDGGNQLALLCLLQVSTACNIVHQWSRRIKYPSYRNNSLLESHFQFSSVHSVVSDSLRPDESQHARAPCPSPTPRIHSDSLSI